MQRSLLELLICPACRSSAFTIVDAQEQTLIYGTTQITEIERGVVQCRSCQARFPIEDYVLSFADRLNDGVRADGTYWGHYYTRLYDYGITGFLDTRSSPAPFLSMGVPQTLPFAGEEWGGTHVQLAEHRWVKPGGRVLDVGVGSGWSSLFLARRGFEVIAFDPAFELMRLAKRYAITQGVYLEYVCADMANMHLRPASIDTVFAFHSLHHVPDLFGALEQIHTMLREGGCLALDDHLQEPMLLALLRDALFQEADEHIFPALRDPRLVPDSRSEHSENEGVGMGQLLPAVEHYLHIDEVHYRHIALDFVGPLYYLQRGCDQHALETATEVVELIKRGMNRAWPDMVEYVMLVAQKRAEPPQPGRREVPHDPGMSLGERFAAQEAELLRLHAVVAEKNAHIQRLERLVGQLENGRVMRLLRLLRRA